MAKIDPLAPAVVRGIQTIGVGRQGSKALTPALAAEIVGELAKGATDPVTAGAFWGALAAKGIMAGEEALAAAWPAGTLSDPERWAEQVSGDAPASVRAICADLIRGDTLGRPRAGELGRFLFGDAPGEMARGFIASLLRVRYETDDELVGLLTAMDETLADPFRTAVPAGAPVCQIAEPFDGTTRSYLVTPLIAAQLLEEGYRPVVLVGRESPGPKFGLGLATIYGHLDGRFATSNAALGDEPPALGWVIDQADLAPAVQAWVERRRRTKKRPFVATLEKFIDPARADLLIASAFHPGYTEKMGMLAETAGFPSAIIMRRGVEGTLTPNTGRPIEVLCTARGADGGYRRERFEWTAAELLPGAMEYRERNIACPTPEENARRIGQHRRHGSSGDALFDQHVALSRAMLSRCLAWIRQQR